MYLVYMHLKYVPLPQSVMVHPIALDIKQVFIVVFVLCVNIFLLSSSHIYTCSSGCVIMM